MLSFIHKLLYIMQKTAFIILSLISYLVFGQQNIVKDINEDGVLDTLNSYYSGGSSFGGRYVKVTNGKTGEIHELNSAGSFSQIKKIILIPPALNKPENILFLDAIKNEMLPSERNLPDPSLQWIINGSYSNIELNNNAYFNQIIDPQINWTHGELKLPHTYYTLVEGDDLRKLYDSSFENPNWYNELEHNKGLLIYYAHNHYRNKSGDSIKLVDSNDTYKIYKTSHGVAVKKKDKYKWLFISDIELTSAPGKLRWESIRKVTLLNKYLIIQQKLQPAENDKLYVINIETGICGSVKFKLPNSMNFNENGKNAFIVEGKSIILNVEGKQVVFKLKDIFKELEVPFETRL